MLFDKKERVGCKHLVFYDMVLYNNEVCQLGGRIKHIIRHADKGAGREEKWKIIQRQAVSKEIKRRWQSRYW